MKFTIFVFVFVLAVQCQSGVAAETEGAANQTAKRITRQLMQLAPDHYLRTTRREDLEDDLFAVQIKVKGKIHKAAYFYEVTETGFEVLSPNEVVFHSSVDGEKRWIAAIDSESGRAFALLGYPRATVNFVALAKIAAVRIANETDANRFLSLYFTSTLGDSFGKSFSSQTDLLCQVVEAFAGNSSKAHRWIQSVPSILTFGFKLQKEASGYRGSLETLQQEPGSTPFIQRLTVKLGADGTVTEPSAVTIYAPKSKN